MRKNLNRKDGLIRTILGIGCIALFFLQVLNDDLVEMVFGVVGFILIISAILEFCPFYYLMGIKTRQKHKKKFY